MSVAWLHYIILSCYFCDEFYLEAVHIEGALPEAHNFWQAVEASHHHDLT